MVTYLLLVRNHTFSVFQWLFPLQSENFDKEGIKSIVCVDFENSENI